ncbi:PREDICTED: putative F-box protein At5g52620 [Camelina sativa]|uniref:F-box protein At5g52620 n=1 Tax=Camelina sativa TaxID=90675 RepID=A0ABM0XF62_CAMSA|nr:PREDICTED: putative F-box protein At5g52620 [Camelina sativa]
MDMEDDSDPIPIDIILEILSRSSAKSIARFGLASKFCASILSRPDFTELFLTKSSSRPRLLFAVREDSRNLWLYSSPQPHNLDKNDPSLIVAADFHMQLPIAYIDEKEVSDPVSSLLYFPRMQISEDERDDLPVICNPSTGQYARLPQMKRKNHSRSLLGYDPISKQFKVLAVTKNRHGEGYILTLGTGRMSWRKVQLRVNHYPKSRGGICINGVLYYLAAGYQNIEKIACFDVRSEKLRFLDEDSTTESIFSCSSRSRKLINYKGKLGVTSLVRIRNYGQQFTRIRLRLWILEDVQKQEWLHREYHLLENLALKVVCPLLE